MFTTDERHCNQYLEFDALCIRAHPEVNERFYEHKSCQTRSGNGVDELTDRRALAEKPLSDAGFLFPAGLSRRRAKEQ